MDKDSHTVENLDKTSNVDLKTFKKSETPSISNNNNSEGDKKITKTNEPNDSVLEGFSNSDENSECQNSENEVENSDCQKSENEVENNKNTSSEDIINGLTATNIELKKEILLLKNSKKKSIFKRNSVIDKVSKFNLYSGSNNTDSGGGGGYGGYGGGGSKGRGGGGGGSSPTNPPPTKDDDPFTILKTLIVLFKMIKSKLRLMSNYINQYETKINFYDQDEDDIRFYNSILIDSRNHFTGSHLAREKKLIYDLNQLLKLFDRSRARKVYKINDSTLETIKLSYSKIEKDVKLYKKNLKNGKPNWIKEDKLKQANTITKEMIRTFKYHIDINVYFLESLENELTFFGIE